MQHSSVNSTNIDSTGYNPETQVLEVKFKNGGLYQYFGVPPDVASSLLKSQSPGQYLNSNIKGYYSHSKVT